MAVRLLVPWMGFHPGDVVERGEDLDLKLIKQGKAERVIVTLDTGRKAEGPKVKKHEYQ